MRDISGVVSAVVVGALLRLVDLGAQSYSMDELWEFAIARLPAHEIVHVGDGFPPLFQLIFHTMTASGLGDFSGRIFSAVLGCATVLVTGLLARRIAPRIGTAAAWGVALAPLLVLLSKEARAYALFIFLATLLLLTTWTIVDAATPRAWAGFVAIAAAGMYTHYMFALALVAAEIVILRDLRRDPSGWNAWLIGHGVLIVLLVPLLLIVAPDIALDASNSYSPTVDVAAIGYLGLSLFTGMTLGPSTRALHTTGAAGAIRGALPWIIVIGVPVAYLLYRGWKALSAEWRFRLLVPFAVPIMLLTLMSAVVGTAFRVRYLSWLVVPLVIWLVAGYLYSPNRLRHVAVGLLAVVSVAALVTRDTIADYEVEDARSAAAYIAEHPGEPTVAMVWYMTRPIEYYLGLDSATDLPSGDGAVRFDYNETLDNRIVPLPSLSEEDPQMVEQNEVFDAAVAVGQEYLFIRSREFHADADNLYFDQRVAADGLEMVAEYAGITIYQGVRGS